jgi:hypothetical protein
MQIPRTMGACRRKLQARLAIALLRSTFTGWPNGPARALDGELRVHDPSTVVMCKGKYYVFSTGPGIPILSSADGFTWQRIGKVFESVPESVHALVPLNKSALVWAPDRYSRHHDPNPLRAVQVTSPPGRPIHCKHAVFGMLAVNQPARQSASIRRVDQDRSNHWYPTGLQIRRGRSSVVGESYGVVACVQLHIEFDGQKRIPTISAVEILLRAEPPLTLIIAYRKTAPAWEPV